jgi:hypothetical protein
MPNQSWPSLAHATRDFSRVGSGVRVEWNLRRTEAWAGGRVVLAAHTDTARRGLPLGTINGSGDDDDDDNDDRNNNNNDDNSNANSDSPRQLPHRFAIWYVISCR